MRAPQLLLASLAVATTSVGVGLVAGADDTVDVTDTTRSFTLSVPAGWTDVLPDPIEYDDGSLLPTLTVGPDVGSYLDGAAEGADVLVVPGPSSPDVYTQEYLDALVLKPGCVMTTPAAESSTPAMPRALIGTWQCDAFVLTIAWGATADDAYLVGVSAVTADAATGSAIVTSLRYAGSQGAPPTTLPVESDGLTITDDGDPATAVVLRRPRTVGARSTVATETVNSSAETLTYVDTGTVQSIEFSSTFRSAGAYEVIAEEPDGAYQVRFVPSTITGDFTTNDPAQESFTGGFAPLVGFAMESWYGSDGLPIGFIAPDGVAPTPEQEQWTSLVPVDGFSLPVAPVGVGATWTADVTLNGVPWFFAEVPATYRLDSIDGDRFSVSMALTVDVATLPPDAFTETMSGTFTRNMWIAGSLSQPGVELVIEESASMHGEFVYGAASDATWTSRRTFTEVPEPATG